MPLCMQCGLSPLGTAEICSDHVCGHGVDWATANRIVRDFLHRGFVEPTPCERNEDLDLLVSLIEGAGADPEQAREQPGHAHEPPGRPHPLRVVRLTALLVAFGASPRICAVSVNDSLR
jgi:hypothetical protein